MIAWEAAAGPTVHRQGSRFARPAPPACGLDGAPLARLFGCHAIVACCARLRSRCKGSARSEHGSVTWRGRWPFSGSAKVATVVPWLPRTNRSLDVRRAAWFGGLFDEARGRLADCAMMKECRSFAR